MIWLCESCAILWLVVRVVRSSWVRAGVLLMLCGLMLNGLVTLCRRLGLPRGIENWFLTCLQQRLVKTGRRLVKHVRYYWLLLAAGHLNQRRPAAKSVQSELEEGVSQKWAANGAILAVRGADRIPIRCISDENLFTVL